MAICDSNYCFRIIDVGSFGKESDCNVFKTSTFGKKLYGDKLNFPPEQCIPNDELGSPQPFVLVADEAFALHKNLLRPFPESKVYHYKVAKRVSWTKVAKTCVDGFENLNDKEKDAKSKKLY
ncbi:uncharacterized protein LOC103309595 [Acyrthosiphon pisum]|uniref:DDE Tnp4 domain-containing protein n=1 Tax=Acyrthosiphon pisum TaxID=7029 RepID=A0A8R2FAE2_ACYPI|nr:uncharacterized protein LOC103309595 [Acyrthosiphon pisum]|eukprot:XP_008183651.1 PREDICTED: uncharacterized protein LOC103309595 [Acyrthosiphon pisum]